MQLEQIRSLRNAVPFRPFSLVLDDGRKFLIERPYYIGIAPTRKFVLVETRDGMASFAPESVTSASFGEPGSDRGRNVA